MFIRDLSHTPLLEMFLDYSRASNRAYDVMPVLRSVIPPPASISPDHDYARWKISMQSMPVQSQWVVYSPQSRKLEETRCSHQQTKDGYSVENILACGC